MPIRYLIAREIGELLGVSYQRVQQLAKHYPDFPEPMVVGRQRMYALPDVERWIATHPNRRPGPQGPRKPLSSRPGASDRLP